MIGDSFVLIMLCDSLFSQVARPSSNHQGLVLDQWQVLLVEGQGDPCEAHHHALQEGESHPLGVSTSFVSSTELIDDMVLITCGTEMWWEGSLLKGLSKQGLVQSFSF